MIEEIERGLSKKTHTDADVKCFVTYVQDLPNGKGEFKRNAESLGSSTDKKKKEDIFIINNNNEIRHIFREHID